LTTPRIADRHLVAYVYQPDEEQSDDLRRRRHQGYRDSVLHLRRRQRRGSILRSLKTGPAIEKFVFQLRPASQAFDDIAELAGYIWYIDYENASTSRER